MDDRYAAFMGLAPKRIPHWEHWSCPDAETYLTGIDYYEHPKLCRDKMRELYPCLELGAIADDTPKTRPQDESDRADGDHSVRWGDSKSWRWDWGAHLKSAEDVFAFALIHDAAQVAHICGRIRTLARAVGQAYFESRERLGFPMLKRAEAA